MAQHVRHGTFFISEKHEICHRLITSWWLIRSKRSGALWSNSWNAEHGVSRSIVSSVKARLGGGTYVWPGAMCKADLTLCQSHRIKSTHPQITFVCLWRRGKKSLLCCEISLKVWKAQRFGADFYLRSTERGKRPTLIFEKRGGTGSESSCPLAVNKLQRPGVLWRILGEKKSKVGFKFY